MDGFRVREVLVTQRLGDEYLIVDLELDEVHVVNESAAVIWEGVRDGLDAVQIEARLRERYDFDAAADPAAMIRGALAALLGKGMLERTDAPPSAASGRDD